MRANLAGMAFRRETPARFLAASESLAAVGGTGERAGDARAAGGAVRTAAFGDRAARGSVGRLRRGAAFTDRQAAPRSAAAIAATVPVGRRHCVADPVAFRVAAVIGQADRIAVRGFARRARPGASLALADSLRRRLAARKPLIVSPASLPELAARAPVLDRQSIAHLDLARRALASARGEQHRRRGDPEQQRAASRRVPSSRPGCRRVHENEHEHRHHLDVAGV